MITGSPAGCAQGRITYFSSAASIALASGLCSPMRAPLASVVSSVPHVANPSQVPGLARVGCDLERSGISVRCPFRCEDAALAIPDPNCLRDHPTTVQLVDPVARGTIRLVV